MHLACNCTGNGPALLFLHGGFVTQDEWRLQVEQFAPRYEVITCDLRGHGESPRSVGQYTMALFAADVVALLDGLGIAQVVCCGHSMGGMVAQELALNYSQRIRALILAETAYCVKATPLMVAGTWLTRWMLRLISIRWLACISAREHGRFNPSVGPYVEQEIARHAADKANYLKIWAAISAFDTRSRLPQIACPTLVLVSEHNRQTHAQAQHLLQTIPMATLSVIPAAGHMLNWGNPAAFNVIVERFVASLPC
jgi:pimeloyl-ACP methyl ester carboxylesterase